MHIRVFIFAAATCKEPIFINNFAVVQYNLSEKAPAIQTNLNGIIYTLNY